MTTVTKRPASRNRSLPRERLRDRIFDAALALFRRHGYDATTVDEIAMRAQVAKGTVFNFFPTKSAILLARYEKLDARFGRALAAMDPRDPRAALARFFGKAETLMRGEGLLVEAIVRETVVDSTLRRADETSGERDRARWSEFFLTCQQRGTVASGFDPGVAGHVVADLWSATAQQWVRSGQQFSLKQRLAEKLELLFSGIEVKPRSARER